MQLCCPTISFICSNYGGRNHNSSRLTNYDIGAVVKKTYHENYPSTHRYYYDAEQGRCMPFNYLGALGNYNNFKSTSECEMFCAKLQCSYGSPLKIGPNNQRCANNVDCPSTHECQADHNVCCPRPRKLIFNLLLYKKKILEAICSQPLRLGDCKQSVRRYWYNAITRACELFVFYLIFK